MRKLFLKILSLISVIRGYNILVLIAAQYLAAIFIFSDQKSINQVIFDWHLFFIVIANVCIIAGGYIINNFYDVNADRINRPVKMGIDSYVKQSTKLWLYFILNFLGFFFGWLVSWRAALFFGSYIFGIWFYSHKLKKSPIIGLFSVTTLTVAPFLSVFIYYKNFSSVIFIHASFLFLVVMIRELIKDLENMKGAIVNNYNTFPIAHGESKTKGLIYFLIAITSIPITTLFYYPAIQYMKYYFYLALLTLILVGFFLSKANEKKQYAILHNILKILLLLGIFSLIFIDKTLLFDKVIEVLD